MFDLQTLLHSVTRTTRCGQVGKARECLETNNSGMHAIARLMILIGLGKNQWLLFTSQATDVRKTHNMLPFSQAIPTADVAFSAPNVSTTHRILGQFSCYLLSNKCNFDRTFIMHWHKSNKCHQLVWLTARSQMGVQRFTFITQFIHRINHDYFGGGLQCLSSLSTLRS